MTGSVRCYLRCQQKKQEPHAYLGLSHALPSLKQTHLHIHLHTFRCTQRDPHSPAHTFTIKSQPLMQMASHATAPVQSVLISLKQLEIYLLAGFGGTQLVQWEEAAKFQRVKQRALTCRLLCVFKQAHTRICAHTLAL